MARQAIAQPHRATQGFVANVTWTWRHPSMTGIEILWRWLFGAPVLAACWFLMRNTLARVPWQATGVRNLSANQLLTDPVGAAAELGAFGLMLWPPVKAIAQILVPLSCVFWMICASTGRTLLLKRMDSRLKAQWFTMRGLQGLRVAFTAGVAWLWWQGVNLIAYVTITRHVLNGGDPRILEYTAAVIVLSLGLFVLSGALNWVFTAAPILAMMHGTGVFRSLWMATRAHGVRGGMAEINLVLSVVKIMLVVLAMAFSAFPLPFTSVITDEYVLVWSALVALGYFAASDFFHVTRLHAFLTLLVADSGQARVDAGE